MSKPWCALLLTPLVALPMVAAAQPLRGRVVSVGDGDTIRVRDGSRILTVRLACIDAPEMAQRPWGEQARRALQKQLPSGAEVLLEVQGSDRYGRTVAEVISTTNINLALVKNGEAFAYRQYLEACNAGRYLDAESRAEAHRLGVWQVEGGITRPWDFRHSLRRHRRGQTLSLAGLRSR